KVFKVEHKEKVWAKIPVDALDQDAPVYHLPSKEASYFREFQEMEPTIPEVNNYEETLKQLLQQPTIARKANAYEQCEPEKNGQNTKGPDVGAAVVTIE